MSPDLTHQLVGYESGNQALVFECAIPRSKLIEVFRIVDVDDGAPDAIDAYALDVVQAREVSGLLNVTLPRPDLLNYLESCQPAPQAQTARARRA